MATFTVWKFDTPGGAETAAGMLRSAESDGLVKVIDRALVTWPEGAARPTTRHTHDDDWRGTGWGAFWGLLFGMLFFIPVLGAAAGAAIGGISKAVSAVGIDDDQLARIRDRSPPGRPRSSG